VHSLPGVQLAASVSSEAEAVDVLQRGDIDVVILDLQLKKGTGFGVLRALRKILKRPSVVVFTRRSDAFTAWSRDCLLRRKSIPTFVTMR
jgi:DNA-binding response OmpR family regulator